MESEDDILLPTDPERVFVLETLADLVARTGYEHLILAPLLEPDARFFPDPWTGGDRSLRRLLRRFFVYADLEDFEVEVVVHDEAELGGAMAPAGPGAPVWLDHVERGVARFGARAAALRDPVLVVPAAARATAEAFRAARGFAETDPRAEQRRVDITTVFLGFGILTTDATIRHGAQRTGGFRLTRQKTMLGVCSPQAMAFALAIAVTARRFDERARRAVAKRLQPNQAGFFRAALEHLREDVPDLGARLGLPPPEQWAAPPDLADLTMPFPPEDSTTAGAPPPEETVHPDRGISGMNAGRNVFRVERTKATRLARTLGLPAILLGMLANRAQMGIEIEMWQAGLVGAALALVGLIVGSFLRDVRCSEPKCGEPLTADMRTCPRCGGEIAGVIHHPRERLAAEEALSRGSTAPETAEATTHRPQS